MIPQDSLDRPQERPTTLFLLVQSAQTSLRLSSLHSHAGLHCRSYPHAGSPLLLFVFLDVCFLPFPPLEFISTSTLCGTILFFSRPPLPPLVCCTISDKVCTIRHTRRRCTIRQFSSYMYLYLPYLPTYLSPRVFSLAQISIVRFRDGLAKKLSPRVSSRRVIGMRKSR